MNRPFQFFLLTVDVRWWILWRDPLRWKFIDRHFKCHIIPCEIYIAIKNVPYQHVRASQHCRIRSKLITRNSEHHKHPWNTKLASYCQREDYTAWKANIIETVKSHSRARPRPFLYQTIGLFSSNFPQPITCDAHIHSRSKRYHISTT